MNRENRIAVVLLVLGVALLANPLYLYPDGVSYEKTYTYEASAVDYLPHTSDTFYRVKSCGWNPLQSAECVPIIDMARGDPVEVELDPDRDVYSEFWSFDYVRTDGRYFEPNATLDGRTLTLSVDPVPTETVKRNLSEDLDESPRYVREAVRNGTSTVTEEDAYEARSHYVESDGRYYVVEPVESERAPTGWGWKAPSDAAIDAMRLAAWIGGVACIWRAGEWTERGR
ncbi:MULTISPECIES: hypothetical protein [Haloferax]|uniref:Uncharacterized protein n=1 Tax=Haloferax massiliensis TaxID=1476858 RepID=A0A0D6JN67_9EURY|nr:MULTISPECIES: hypothetical protein [Haloferax]MDS0242628.1 hypothetical protein [Haloferax sp. S2CR25]MDS0445749.1 hypothetical protein [Haloferax sp. S2CR25-2]CQR49337.1 hypothetical protein BN996_00797 [Haloferax massiliensis]